MNYDLVDVKYVGGYKLKLTFADRKGGIVDFKDYSEMGGVFGSFKDIKYFKKYYINRELGVLCWPGDVDVAPEVLYSEATGEPLPAWMRGKPESNGKRKVKMAV